MANPRRRSGSKSPHKNVSWPPGRPIKGSSRQAEPSHRQHHHDPQPAQEESNSSEDTNMQEPDMTESDMEPQEPIVDPREQLQRELVEASGIAPVKEIAPVKDDSSEDAEEFWRSLPPGASFKPCAIQFNKLDDAKKDYRVCKGMNFLVEEIWQFAHEKTFKEDYKTFNLDSFLIESKKELIRYIGCLAQGGKAGKHGWHTLLTDFPSRQALVVGVVGRALEEHVFSALFFGGGSTLTEKLHELELAQEGDEGFSRTNARSIHIIGNRPYRPGASVPDFEKEVDRITSNLSEMLFTLCDDMGDKKKRDEDDRGSVSLFLHSIVLHAGQLTRMMRLASDVVYYWPPTFKDEEFEPGRMEALNLTKMIEESPYEKKADANGRDRAILKEGKEDQSEAIVRVVCFPGLVAYRQFGGDLAKKEIAAEKRQDDHVPADVRAHRRRAGEEELTEQQGIRSKVIRKSLVLLQWGQQRLLTKEAGTSSHIDAVRDDKMDKYDQDYRGFVELYTLGEKLWGKGRK